MLPPIRIRFTALSCFETNIYQRVFLRGRTYANKAPIGKQFFLLASPKKKKNRNKQTEERWQGHRNSCVQLQRFVNKHFIIVPSVRLI